MVYRLGTYNSHTTEENKVFEITNALLVVSNNSTLVVKQQYTSCKQQQYTSCKQQQYIIQ